MQPLQYASVFMKVDSSENTAKSFGMDKILNVEGLHCAGKLFKEN